MRKVSSDHFKSGDLTRKDSAMAHGMTSAMTLVMALMMIFMVGPSLALGARKVRAAARRAPGRSRGPVGPGQGGDG
jgi:hypothetical protein